ncbi:MAG: amidohydrolase family protein, partial [Planctomycetota bacterium]|nr:amidohydrolase family protein [Planctomycetota bacterium]
IRNATIWTVSEGRIDGGVVLVKDGKISAVGKRLEIPHAARVIDAYGGHVIPGMIDIQSELYLGSRDRAEKSRFGASLDVTNALDLFTPAARQVLQEGVTAVYVGPGTGGLIGGLGAVLRVGTEPDLDSAVLRREAALKINLGLARDRTSAEWRLGHYHEIRKVLRGAEQYRETWEKYEEDLAKYEKEKKEFDKKEEAKKKDEKKKPDDKKDKAGKSKEKKPAPPKKPRKPSKKPDQEILVRALAGEIPVRLQTEWHDSIRNALHLADEFDLDWVLEGGADATTLTASLVEAKISVIVGPIVTSPLGGVDAARSKAERAGLLAASGIKVAIGSGGGGALGSRYLRYQACLAVRHGMDREAALKAITIVPAEILGVSDRIGSITEGRDADLVILDGDPLKSLSRVTHVIRGEKVIRITAPEPRRRDF